MFKIDDGIFKNFFGIDRERINSKIIISPYIPAKSFNSFIEKKEEFCGILFSGFNTKDFTYIKSGIGSNLTGDCVLCLKYSPAKSAVFIGSIGGMNGLALGDIVMPKRAYNGEGFSKYHKDNAEPVEIHSDKFVDIDTVYLKKTIQTADKLNINYKVEDIFTIGSIFGEEDSFLKFLEKESFFGVDLELSAFFSASKKIGINYTAITYVSDLPLSKPLHKMVSHKNNVRSKNPLKTSIELAIKIIE